MTLGRISILASVVLILFALCEVKASNSDSSSGFGCIDRIVAAFWTIFGNGNSHPTHTEEIEQPLARMSMNFVDTDTESIVVEANFGENNFNSDSITFEEEVCEMPKIKWNNRCFILLTQGPCSPSQWIVLNRTSGLPYCKPRECSEGNENREECLRRARKLPQEECPEGMRLYWNNYGETECDCLPSWIFFPRRNRCYPAYRQGPCLTKYFLVYHNYQASCEFNTCQRDGWVPYSYPGRGTGRVFFPGETRESLCYELNSPGPCGQDGIGMLMVNASTLRLNCEGPKDRPVAVIATLSCPLGSKRDALGNCRKSW